MQYAILCDHDEKVTFAWSREQDDAVMAKPGVVMEKYAKAGKLGPVARLLQSPSCCRRPAVAHHRGNDLAQGPRTRAGHRRPVRRDHPPDRDYFRSKETAP